MILFHFQIQKYQNAIIETENQLFNLRFKKATRQSFKSHEIKNAKRRLAQLKTILVLRLKDLDQKEENDKVITN
nr:hypothetical protein DMDDKFKA_00167 [Haslea ostrearia]